MTVPSDAPRTTSAAALTSTDCPSTALDLLDTTPAVARRKWSCGEADWLTEVGGVTKLKTTVGYPLHFGVRAVLELMQAGVTPGQAMALGRGSTVEEVIAACRR